MYPAKCGAVMIGDLLSEADIVRFEERLDTRLPEDYREFLLEWNGAIFLGRDPQDASTFAAAFPTYPIENHPLRTPEWTDWAREQVSPYDEAGVLGFLFGIYGKEKGYDVDLTNANEGYEFDKWVPKRFQVIGEQSHGYSFICISLSGEDRGHIYDWAYPEGKEPQPGVNCPSLKDMSWIAPNFREFWDVLRELKEVEYLTSTSRKKGNIA
jgi:hypothetical protein